MIKAASVGSRNTGQYFLIDFSIFVYKGCEVNTAEEATTAIGKGLFTTRVGGSNLISRVITIHIPIKNAVPEKSARFSHHPVVMSHIFKKRLRVKFFMNEFFSCFTNET